MLVEMPKKQVVAFAKEKQAQTLEVTLPDGLDELVFSFRLPGLVRLEHANYALALLHKGWQQGSENVLSLGRSSSSFRLAYVNFDTRGFLNVAVERISPQSET